MSASGGSAHTISLNGFTVAGITTMTLGWSQRILTVVSSLQVLTQGSHVNELRRLVRSASNSFLQSFTTSISIHYAIFPALSWQQPRRFPLPGAS